MSRVWITWERQQRNVSMARLFDAEYYEVNIKGSRIKRYLRAIQLTVRKFRESPDILFCQNPSIVLSFLCVTWGRIHAKTVVVDAHNSGVKPLEGKYPFLNKVNLWVLKRSDLVIVSNESLSKYLEVNGVAAVAMPDPLPMIQSFPGNINEHKIHKEKLVLVICSWSEDEPIELYMDVAMRMSDVNFYFTGNFKKYYKSKPLLSSNINLLGFISEEEYFRLLTNSSVILDLTTRVDCLVCGAYEAISAGVPVVLTNTSVNKETFPIGAILSDLNSENLEQSIRIALEPSSDRNDMVRLKKLLTRLEEENKNKVLLLIDEQKNTRRVA